MEITETCYQKNKFASTRKLWVKSACEKQILSNQLNFLLGHCDKNNRSRELDRQNTIYPDFAQDSVAVPYNMEKKNTAWLSFIFIQNSY